MKLNMNVIVADLNLRDTYPDLNELIIIITLVLVYYYIGVNNLIERSNWKYSESDEYSLGKYLHKYLAKEHD